MKSRGAHPASGHRPAALVLDFDGTIADTEWPEFTAVRAAFRAHGLDLAPETWVGIVGRADHPHWTEMLATELGRPPDPAVVETTRRVREAVGLSVPLRPGVADLLTAVRAAGLGLAVASSSPRDWVEGHLERLGVVVDVIRTRDDVDRAKPWPDLYLAAAAALDVDPAACLAVEDSRHGCRAAKAAGMTCVVVPNRLTALDPPPDADLVLGSLVDFPYRRFGLDRPPARPHPPRRAPRKPH